MLREVVASLTDAAPDAKHRGRDLTAAQSCPGFDRSDIPLYSEQVLKWWRVNNPCFPKWAVAARMSPNSASCERVLSLLKQMFGLDQKSMLADYLQAALMLRYNKRVARG